MTPREKSLAGMVGGMLVLVVGYFGYGAAAEMLSQRKQRVDSLETQIENKQTQLVFGRRAASQMSRYAEHSLPSDLELARSQYQAWLLDLVNRIGLGSSTVKADSPRARGDVYFEHVFAVTGRGSLQQLTDLLHEFYALDLLHRISSLSVRQIPESELLEIALKIEALSLSDAPPTASLPSAESNRLAHSREEYRRAILNRNLFGPPNNPPRLSSLGRKEVSQGEKLSLEITARDPDERQSLQYALVGQPPPGMRIDRRSGRLEWSPDELGEYPVTVQVTDNGLPAKQDEIAFTVAVVEPPAPAPEPPAKPEFNLAQYSVLTAIVEKSGRKEIWIHIRPEGRMLKLHEGDEIAIGDFTGIVAQIAQEQVVIETSDDALVLAQGKALTDAQPLP